MSLILVRTPLLAALVLLTMSPFAHAMCDSYCKNPCAQFAHPADTVRECSDCTDDGSVKCFPGAAGYNGEEPAAKAATEESAPAATEESAPAASGGEDTLGKTYEGIKKMPFAKLVDDKAMKMVVFHWKGEKGGDDLAAIMQELKTDPNHSDYDWYSVDASADEGAAAEFKQESLPMTFSQTPEDGIGHFNGGEFTVANFQKWHAFRMGDGWKDGDKVVRLEKDDLPEKLVEMTQKGPVFVKMYEEWCHHCKSMKPHFKRSSNEVTDVQFVEIECATAGGFCNQFFPANGFPRVHFVNKGGTKTHKYEGYTYDKMTAFAKDKSKWKFDVDTGLPGAVETKDEL